ncbi:hypothetical protein [Stigmatella hybrida]|uniref:hypothetical protein n=1 Tax=Stigmatella hybrida TaxID=394097 RepID=UPI001CDAB538|nr:hypothetical protein [Stigmatella hybrida]
MPGAVSRLWKLLSEFGALLLLAGCAPGPAIVSGRITPGHFRFKTVVAVDSRESHPDGWRAVCIHARITEGDSKATDLCKFEVGVPIRNIQRKEIPLWMAQQTAAVVANEAAHSVLSEAQRGEMIAILCRRFKLRYQRLLSDEINGARVSQCEIQGLEIVYFDIPGNPRSHE